MTERLKIHKAYRALIDEALERGWVLTYRGKHPKLTAPDGDYAMPVPSADSKGLVATFTKRLRSHPSFTDDPPVDPPPE